MTIAGGVLLVVAAVLVFVHVRARKRIGALLSARRATAGELAQIARTVAGEVGGGGFSEMAELVGQVRCDRPLVSPLGERPCLYYTMSVRRQYEEDYEERDSNGNVRRRTRRGSETMSSQSEHAPFELVDETGSVEVRLDGADYDQLVETVDRFEPAAGGMHGGLVLGRFSMSVPALGHGRRTLGYQYEEKVLPLEGPLTIVGQVTDQHGGLAVARGGLAFIVSRRSKGEMLGKAKSTATWTSVASGVVALVGAGLLIAGLIAG